MADISLYIIESAAAHGIANTTIASTHLKQFTLFLTFELTTSTDHIQPFSNS